MLALAGGFVHICRLSIPPKCLRFMNHADSKPLRFFHFQPYLVTSLNKKLFFCFIIIKKRIESRGISWTLKKSTKRIFLTKSHGNRLFVLFFCLLRIKQCNDLNKTKVNLFKEDCCNNMFHKKRIPFEKASDLIYNVTSKKKNINTFMFLFLLSDCSGAVIFLSVILNYIFKILSTTSKPTEFL